jgi:hypothetical protein
VCNTRLAAGERSCPNCGVTPAEAAFTKKKRPAKLPAATLSTAQELEQEDVVELDDITEDPAPANRGLKAAKAARKSTGSGSSRSGSSSGGSSSGSSSGSRKQSAPAPTPLAATDPDSLRSLLAEQPETLEKGLSVYCDDKGTPLGAGYSSGVGDIDLLAVDGRGELVVVMILEPGQGEELVALVLQRIGWVRKHVGDGNDRVRGIVLCEEAPESLSYTAAAVSDTVKFKTWRVALTFEDLEL